jgi:hypothetical protein
MSLSLALCKRMIVGLTLALALAFTGPVIGEELAEDMVGQPADAWTTWQTAVRALEREELDKAGKELEAIAGMKLSDLRLCLMADRTGSIRLQQWATTADAPDVVKRVVEKIEAGRKQRTLAEDGWHYAAVGRFNYADANFKALADSNPDPVALLELARLNPNRHQILLRLLANTDVGPAAKRFLEILNEGEERLRMDPYEIAANIARLSAEPRMAFNAATRLKASGEYAIPQLIQALRQPDQRQLQPAIIQLIPQIGRAGLNPLCVSLAMNDDVTKQVIIKALGQIGYRQALPYLAKLASDGKASAAVVGAAQEAMAAIGQAVGGDVSALFCELADGYYNSVESLKADPRSDTANIWFMQGNELRFIPVPLPIFGDVMAMRCCEEALKVDANNAQAIALWLAGDFRRETRLGMNVESDLPDPLSAKDGTRPEDFPRSIYFARAAGPKYNHMVLARAVKDRDPGVALGSIAALRVTAGAPSLVGAQDLKQPLVQSLDFPNRQVRIKAALALGNALPRTEFAGAANVMPVLSEALTGAGRQAALVVDPNGDMMNRFQTILRAAGYDSAGGANLYQAMEAGKKENLASYDVVFLATDLAQPDLAGAVSELRKQFLTSATPIVVIVKAGEMAKAREVTQSAVGVVELPVEVIDLGDPALIQEQITSKIARSAQALGMSALDKDLSLELALQTAEVLRGIGESNLKVFDFAKAVPALIMSLSSKSEALRIKSTQVLALANSADAQTAIAGVAMNAERGAVERMAAFASLADSARRNGNLLGSSDLVQKLIDFTMNEKDLVMRAAASKALGALDLPGNKASEIIRAQKGV